jgi:hypothetical protein
MTGWRLQRDNGSEYDVRLEPLKLTLVNRQIWAPERGRCCPIATGYATQVCLTWNTQIYVRHYIWHGGWYRSKLLLDMTKTGRSGVMHLRECRCSTTVRADFSAGHVLDFDLCVPRVLRCATRWSCQAGHGICHAESSTGSVAPLIWIIICANAHCNGARAVECDWARACSKFVGSSRRARSRPGCI